MGLICSFAPRSMNPRFSIHRWFAPRLAVNWANQFVVSCGNPLVLQETIYGGFQLHIEFKSWFWHFSNKSIRVPEMFENFYVTPPGGGPPSAAFTCLWDWHIAPTEPLPDVVIIVPGATNRWTFLQTPDPPSGYWQGKWPQNRPQCQNIDIP